MRYKHLCLVLFLIFFSFQCTQVQKKESDIYRFLDRIKKENIIISPLLDPSYQDISLDEIYPSDSSPIFDEGIKENPFEIKRKLILYNKEEVNALFSFEESEYILKIDLPKNPVFEFGIGLWRKNKKASEETEPILIDNGAAFLVTLKAGETEELVFQEHIELTPQHEEYVFFRYQIDLPPRDKVTLSLKTIGDSEPVPFWINPVIYNKEQSGFNIILISIDTLRADHLGCYGYERNTSPVLDDFASKSAVFKNVYSTSPWTLPAHVSLFTSLYEVKHQVSKGDEKIRPSLRLLPEILKRNGYFCSAVTGGGFVSSLFGFSQGFDSYFQQNNGLFVEESASWVYEHTSQWLDRNKDKNFFLFVHTYQPHTPYACPPPYNTMFCQKDAKWDYIGYEEHLGGDKGRYRGLSEEEKQNVIDIYDGEIRFTDEFLIKPLIEKLKNLNLYDESLIIITSDHGEEFFDHEGWGHSHTLYDELLRVPLIIKFPDDQYSGMKFDNIVRLVDIMPTILDELDIKTAHHDLDGKSLVPILKQKETADRSFLAYKQGYLLDNPIPEKYAMNQGKEKLIFNESFTEEDLSFFSDSPPIVNEFELYNLGLDPLEFNNLASERPNLVRQIFKRIDDFIQKIKKIDPSKLKVDEKTKEQLRALGYIR
jgi:arylsulfatase A-like enzyme